jgi:hypothetical protein
MIIHNSPPTLYFLDLIELSGTTADEIVKAVLQCLHILKFTDAVLKDRWL